MTRQGWRIWPRTGFFKPVHMKSLSAHALRSLIIARKKTGGPASDLGKSDPRFGGCVKEHNPSIPVARCAQIPVIVRPRTERVNSTLCCPSRSAPLRAGNTGKQAYVIRSEGTESSHRRPEPQMAQYGPTPAGCCGTPHDA